jgi:hypothetical protein
MKRGLFLGNLSVCERITGYVIYIKRLRCDGVDWIQLARTQLRKFRVHGRRLFDGLSDSTIFLTYFLLHCVGLIR